MALYGFRYQSATISTYNTSSSGVKSETVTKPFAPFVPKFNSGDDEYVEKKKQIPIGRRPYEYENDDERKHERSPRKPHPPTSIPVTSPHWGHSYQPKPYGYNNKEGYSPKPTSTPVYDDGYHADHVDYKPKPTSTPVYNDVYGADYGDYINKEKNKPKPAFTPVYNDEYGDYNNKEGYKPRPSGSPVYNNGYGADYGDYNNKEGYKPRPSGSPVYNDGYGTDYGDYKAKPSSTPVYNDGYGADYGDYNNKQGYNPKPKPSGSPVYNGGYRADYGDYKPKPTSTPVYNDGYGADYGDYSNKQGYKPKPKPSGSPVYSDGYGADYGDYNNKQGYKPTVTPVYNDGFGGDYGNYNNKEGYKPNDGHGGDYGNYSKDGPKPKSIEIPVYNNGYGIGGASPARQDYGGYGNYPNNKEGNKLDGPKSSPGWSATGIKGTPLSKSTNNIDEAIEMLKKEAAMRNGPKQYDSKPYYDGPEENGNGGPRAATRKNEKNMNLVNESEKLKKIVTKGPQTPTASSLQMQMKPNSDGRRPDYGVIDHKEAEKKFKGITI